MLLAEAPLPPGTAAIRRDTGTGAAAFAIAVLAAGIAAGAGMRMAFSPLQELVKAELGLSDTQLGLVQGLATALPIAILSLPLGRLTDRSNRVVLLALLAIASIVGSGLTALAGGFGLLFVGRMLAGLSGLCALPVAISFVADIARPERRGRALVLLQIGQMAGGAAAFALGGGIVGRLAPLALPLVGALSPWRQVQLIFLAIGVVALLPLLMLREPPRHEIASATNIRLRDAIVGLWARRGFLAPLFLGQLTVVMADSAASIWASPVLIREHGLQPADFAGWMGLVLLVSGLVGASLGGVAADLGQKGKLPGGILAGAIVAAACAIPAAFFAVSPGVGLFGWGLGLLLVCGSATGIVTATAIAVHVPNELRGFCLGLFVVIGAIGGFGIAPSVVPLLSGLLGGEHHVGMALAMLTGTTSAVALIGFTLALRHMPRHIG